MYSYEDRLHAVRLHIKLGKRAGLTIWQLGYPTKNALKAWHSEFEQPQGLSTGYTRQPKCTTAHREQAVQHYLEHGRCLSATIKAWATRPGRCSLVGFGTRILKSARVWDKPTKRCHRRRSSLRSWRCACGKEMPKRSPRSWGCPGLRCTTGGISCSATRRWHP